MAREKFWLRIEAKQNNIKCFKKPINGTNHEPVLRLRPRVAARARARATARGEVLGGN